jgi:EmrB/QacA subfamily drug resistance transporter
VTAGAPSGDARGPLARQHYGITLGVLTLSALAYALSQTLVAPALPAIQHELGTSTTAITFVLTAYLLSASVATPIVGRLGDMFGKERVLVLTLSGFGLGTLIAALSSSIEMLVAGRVVQGVGGAVFPLAFGIIRDEFPRERVGTGIGLISATFGIGGGVGLVLSGVIVENLSYEWMFWLVLPVVVFAVVMTRLFIPESPVRDRVKIDWVGAALLSAGLVALLVAVSEGNDWGWLSAPIVALLVGAVAILALWSLFEARQPAPMVDMQMMRARPVWTTNLAGLLLGFGMFGSFILIPQLVQVPVHSGYGFGASVTDAGLFMLPSTMVMLFAGPLAGRLGDRIGSKLPLVVGTAVAALSFALLAVAHDHRWAIYVSSAMLGLGIGFSFAAVANLIVDAVDQHQTGVATGINTIMRTIGGAIGGQVVAAILAAELLAGGYPASSAFTTAFIVSGAGVTLALAAALLIPGSLGGARGRRSEAGAAPDAAGPGAGALARG